MKGLSRPMCCEKPNGSECSLLKWADILPFDFSELSRIEFTQWKLMKPYCSIVLGFEKQNIPKQKQIGRLFQNIIQTTRKVYRRKRRWLCLRYAYHPPPPYPPIQKKVFRTEVKTPKNNLSWPPYFFAHICFEPPWQKNNQISLDPPAWLSPLIKNYNPERLLR